MKPARLLLLPLIAAALLGGAACEDASTNKPPSSLPSVDGGGGDAGGRDPEGKAPLRPGTVRVATFNVRLFFDQTCDSGTCGTNDFEKVATAAGYSADVERIAIAISKIDPDVIALQEIETQGCLDDLVAKLAQKGLKYPVAHLGEIGTGGSVDVAVLARGTLGEVKTHRDTPLTRPDGSKTTFSRELLEVRFDLGGKPIAMFAAHFRSKASDDPGRRLAEAKATQSIMTATAAELPDALVMLGGDLNDEPGSEPLNAMELNGDLVRLAAELAPAQQGTYTFSGKVEAIDHLFVGKGTFPRYVTKSIRVVRDATTGGLGSSDHAALSADLSLD